MDVVDGEDEVRGVGEAAGGLVSAEVGADGLLAVLRLNPRALRLGSEPLAEHIVSAVRTAQRDRLSQVAPDEPPAAGTEPAALVGRLDEMEIRANRDFERLTATLEETLRHLDGRQT
ncbi:YbaB/EbfC family nucleoid-associated protein [Streptosporangium sp. KLBMP 9127]|nr:YbaB/EbfC family nucleoid-associated protein [Streptosporangium sp. KLBMP 9127]